jgi:hypothetical protein
VSRGLLLGAALLLAAGCRPATGPVDASRYAHCDGKRDDRRHLARAVDAAAGRTLRIPSGCRMLLSSPGDGEAVATLRAGTRVVCDDPSAGFVLARRACRGGRYPDAACASDAECLGGGTCAVDTGGSSFAPNPDAAYTVLRAAAEAGRLEIRGCRFEMNGIDAPSRCVGGPNDGKPCDQRCAPDALLAGISCNADADCGPGSAPGACLRRDDCSGTSPPGECRGDHQSPAGPGRIHPIDLTRSTGNVVAANLIEGQPRGDFAINAGGGNSHVDDNELHSERGMVEQGILLEGADAVRGNLIEGARVGVGTTLGFNTISDNKIAGDNHPGSLGIYLRGQSNRVVNNHVQAYGCIRGDPIRSINQTIIANRCLGGSGEKIVATGSGWLIQDNYLAWGGQASHTQILIGDDGQVGQGTGHTLISGNLLFSDQPGVTLIRFADAGARCITTSPKAGQACSCGPRECTRGSQIGLICEKDDDCPDSVEAGRCAAVANYPCTNTRECGANPRTADCVEQPHLVTQITGNVLMGAGPGSTAIDASLGPSPSGRTRISNLSIVANNFSEIENAIVLPSQETNIRDLFISANQLASGAERIVNWRDAMGTQVANSTAERGGRPPAEAAANAPVAGAPPVPDATRAELAPLLVTLYTGGTSVRSAASPRYRAFVTSPAGWGSDASEATGGSSVWGVKAEVLRLSCNIGAGGNSRSSATLDLVRNGEVVPSPWPMRLEYVDGARACVDRGEPVSCCTAPGACSRSDSCSCTATGFTKIVPEIPFPVAESDRMGLRLSGTGKAGIVKNMSCAALVQPY